MSEPECPNCIDMAIKPMIVYDTNKGESTCSGCGEVLLSRPVDEAHDWRNFADSDQDNSRVGSVDPYSSGQMTTRFAVGNSRQAQQLAWSHNKVNMDTTTKNLMEASDVMNSLGQSLNLTQHIVAKAKELYKQYETNRASSQRKATCRALMVAIVYIACNQEGFSRTFKELAKSSSVTEKDLRSYIKTVQKVLPNTSTPPSDPSTLVDRFCSRLHTDMPEWVKIGASQIAKKAFTTVLEGKQPATVAAGSILLAAMLAGIHLDADAIATATQSISGSTVSATCNKLSQHKNEVVSAEYQTRAAEYRAKNAPKPSSSSSAPSSMPVASSSNAGGFVPPKPPVGATFTAPLPLTSKPTMAPAQKLVPLASTPSGAIPTISKPSPMTSIPTKMTAPITQS